MKKLIWVGGFVLILHHTAISQDDEITYEQKVYKTVHGQELKVDVFYNSGYLPQQENPAIAFFHGGGWAFGNPSEFHNACKRFARKGFVTFSFEYRLSINEDGTYPNPSISPIESVKDARSAIRWMKVNAASLGIDPDRIVVSGQSAGGQLALSTVLMDDINEDTDDLVISPMPAALVLYSSCVNTMEAWIDNLMGDRREEIWSISPYHNVKSGMPPTIAFHGESDCMVLFYTMEFFRGRMNAFKNPFELVTFEGRDHYLGGDREGQYAGYFDDEILQMTDRFLAEHGLLE